MTNGVDRVKKHEINSTSGQGLVWVAGVSGHFWLYLLNVGLLELANISITDIEVTRDLFGLFFIDFVMVVGAVVAIAASWAWASGLGGRLFTIAATIVLSVAFKVAALVAGIVISGLHPVQD